MPAHMSHRAAQTQLSSCCLSAVAAENFAPRPPPIAIGLPRRGVTSFPGGALGDAELAEAGHRDVDAR